MLKISAKDSRRTLKLDLEEDLPEIWADRQLTRRALVNLLMNALKYTPQNTEITIRTKKDGNPEFVRFEIEDEGAGIAPEDRELIFERYAQVGAMAQGKRRGIGLGLTFCRLAIHGMDGEIGIDEPAVGNQGSRFYFVLPKYDSQKSDG
jgi:signal transduction histidine kinase